VAAAGFCSRSKQLRNDIGIPNPGCNKYRGFATVVALVDVTLGRNELSDNIGVSVLGGGPSWRSPAVAALVNVTPRRNELRGTRGVRGVSGLTRPTPRAATCDVKLEGDP
jgi:hypothetical protein